MVTPDGNQAAMLGDLNAVVDAVNGLSSTLDTVIGGCDAKGFPNVKVDLEALKAALFTSGTADALAVVAHDKIVVSDAINA